MSRTKANFRQRDVTAAVKAVEAAGHAVKRVEITPDGRILVITGKVGDEKESPSGTAPLDKWLTEHEN